MLYFIQLLYLSIVNKNLREAIIKGGLIRCITAGSQYKAIDIILEYQNTIYAINIKNNKNSIYNIEATLLRFSFNSNVLATIRKGSEGVYRRIIKGIHIAGNPFTDIILYALKLYSNGIIKRKTTKEEINPNIFDVPDLYTLG